MNIKTYSELIKLDTFEERFLYLKLDGIVGNETFGSYRYLNQKYYKSDEWISTKNYIIARDNGCDMGLLDYPIKAFGEDSGLRIERPKIIVHHINPIAIDDIINHSYALTDPDNLITTLFKTHNAIHYGDTSIITVEPFARRSKNDTCPWRK